MKQVQVRTRLHEYKEYFRSYAKMMNQEFFNNSPYFYILLIPIALSYKKDKKHQERIGATFLHFGITEKLNEEQLLNIYQKIILYWHFNLTARVLKMRQDQIIKIKEQAIRAQEQVTIFEQINIPVNELVRLLKEANKPLSDLIAIKSPLEILGFKGEALGRFFIHDGSVDLAPGITIETAHNFPATETETKKFIRLIPAIILEALGASDNCREPLWDYLRLYLDVPPSSIKNLSAAIKDILPILNDTREEAADKNKNEELKETFNTLKEWFSEAYKPQNYEGSYIGLHCTFIQVILQTLRIDYTSKLDMKKDRIWFPSARPIDTTHALNLLHHEYTIKKVKLCQIDGNSTQTHIIRLTLEKSHSMTTDDAKKLHKRVVSGLENEEHFVRGSGAQIFCKLFGLLKENNAEKNLKLHNENETHTFMYCSSSQRKFKVIFENTNIITIQSTLPSKR